MADYFTAFSCLLNVGLREAAIRALELYQNYEAELDRDGVTPGFHPEIDEAA